MPSDEVTITISRRNASKLANASVERMITYIEQFLLECDCQEDTADLAVEVGDLKFAFDECSRACKQIDWSKV